jgi:O-antigen/teichoic acid export membrane protein
LRALPRARPAPVQQQTKRAADARALRRDTGSMALSTLVVSGLNFTFTLALTWLLPVHEYSVFAAAQTLLLMAVNISSASLPWVVAHAVASNPSDGKARKDAVSFVVVTCFLEGAVLAGIAVIIASQFSSAAVLAVLVLDVVVIFATAPAVGYLQGTGSFGKLSALRVANILAKLGSGFALVLAGAGAVGALLSYTFGDVPLLVVGSMGVARELKPRLAALRSWYLWRQTLGLAAIQGGVAALAGLDLVLATVLWNGRPAGPLAGYQVAILLSRVPFFLSSSLGQTVFQKLSAGHESGGAVVRTTAHMLVLVFVPVAILIATVPGPLVHRFFPTSYSDIELLVPWTAASGLLIAAINVVTTFFQARQRYVICITALLPGLLDVGIVAVGFHVGGLLGMAIGSVIGLALVLAVLMALAARSWPLRGALRPVNAVPVVAALGAVPLHGMWLLWLPYAAAVFTACCYVAFWRERSEDG